MSYTFISLSAKIRKCRFGDDVFLISVMQRCLLFFIIAPSSEYVITLRAFNSMGEGVPVYETTRTREEAGTLIYIYIVKLLITTASI